MSSQLFQSLIYLALAVGLTACGGGGGSPSDITSSTTSTSAPTQSSVDSVTQGFAQSILLAAPTDSSIRISVLSPMTGVLTLAYQANLAMQAIALQAGIITPDIPREIYLSDLKPNTRYTYTLSLQTGASTLVSPTYSFTTARTEGSSFTFTLQADSHLDENSDLDVYLVGST
jgi:hypothetical protein